MFGQRGVMIAAQPPLDGVETLAQFLLALAKFCQPVARLAQSLLRGFELLLDSAVVWHCACGILQLAVGRYRRAARLCILNLDLN